MSTITEHLEWRYVLNDDERAEFEEPLPYDGDLIVDLYLEAERHLLESGQYDPAGEEFWAGVLDKIEAGMTDADKDRLRGAHDRQATEDEDDSDEVPDIEDGRDTDEIVVEDGTELQGTFSLEYTDLKARLRNELNKYGAKISPMSSSMYVEDGDNPWVVTVDNWIMYKGPTFADAAKALAELEKHLE